MKLHNPHPHALETHGRLYDRELFLALLRRERAMALRNGHYFSLIEITLPATLPPAMDPARIADLLSQRLRKTDAAGWLTDTTLGIILPATSPGAAASLAEEFKTALAARELHTEHCVHACPAPTVNDTEPAAPGRAAPDAADAADADRVGALLFAGIPRWKRLLDIVLALLLLVLLSPVLLLIAIGIELVSPGPVLFCQTRIGHLGVPFTCRKFRSMRVGAAQDLHERHVASLLNHGEPLTKLESLNRDTRLIPLGRLLRASGLDELPQLVNVLRGEMSLVGPRPCVPYEYAAFATWHHDRCATPPGITGLWQVSGKNDTTFEQMMRLDIEYAQGRSLAADLGILLRTPLVPLVQLWQCAHHQDGSLSHSQTTQVTTPGVSA